MIYSVSTVAQLTSALASAQGGDTIRLSPGTYSGLSLTGLNYASNVTITSLNSANPAVLAPFYLRNSSNITFSNIDFSADGSSDPYAFRVYNSQSINYKYDIFHGTMTSSPTNSNSAGLGFFSCSNVGVQYSNFTHLAIGLVTNQTSGGTFIGNNFFDLRHDGIDNDTSNNLTISDNTFTDFYPQAADHPDSIQFWTTGANNSTYNITVTGNLTVRGSGAPIQGVFLRQIGTLPFNNINIIDNTVVGGMDNGIAVLGGATNVTVVGNIMGSFSDFESAIRMESVDKLKETGNAAPAYINSSNTNVASSGNITNQYISDNGQALVAAWVIEHPGLAAALPASLAALGGGAGPAPTGAQAAAAKSEFLIENTKGVLDLGALGTTGQTTYSEIGALGAEWRFDGSGDFFGDGKIQFLIENTKGAVVLGEIGSNGQAAYTQVSALGPEWKFVGTGDFVNLGFDQFLIENTSGAVDVGTVGSNGKASYAQVTSLGPEWTFRGVGDLYGDGQSQFVIESTSGVVDVAEVGSNGLASFAQVASLGAQWTFGGVGAFLGDGRDQFLIENTNGTVDLGEVGTNGKASYTQIASLGSEWKFVGAGDYSGTGLFSFLIENTNGVVDTGTVVGGKAQFAQVSGLGAEWSFRG